VIGCDEFILDYASPSFQSIVFICIICLMNIGRLDLNLLKVLDALLREQHVSRAAALLNLSQPATSAALARLRDALGDPLLVRTAAGMQPTERAVELAPQVRELLENINRVLAAPQKFDPQSAEESFAVASTDYFIELANTVLVKRLSKQAPHIQFAWRGVMGERLVQRLERGELDFAVTSRARAPESLRSRPLLTETFVGIARKNHAAARNSMPLDTFCRLPHVLVSPVGNDVFHGAMDDALAARGLARRVAFSVPQFRFAVDIVESTDAIAVFPARLAAQYASRVRRFALPITPPRFEIVLLWHERTHRSASHLWLREQLHACVEKR
jgi:DNA-binding transcriptional LysR family regulator